MNTYKVNVILVNKVSRYQVLNASGFLHSQWDSFEGASFVARDLNRMVRKNSLYKV